MNDFLKHYKVKIHALSPIYIGNGVKIGKKEYIHLPWDRLVIIPDIERMYQALSRKGLAAEYQTYLLKNNRDDLGVWLKQKGYQKKDYLLWKKYTLDAGDVLIGNSKFEKASAKEIAAFIKDPYGQPYVPGSSLKGMMRTALLARELIRNEGKYAQIKRQIREGLERHSGRSDQCLRRETANLEAAAFHTLNRSEKLADAVNCNLSGLIVSDSLPIKADQLILCQKIDYALDGKERPLPILREALKPGTDLYFEISIDQTLCPYRIEDILEALNLFQEMCYRFFYARFKRGKNQDGIIWLGGGTGFLSKTIIYPMFQEEGYQIADQVFRKTIGRKYEEHKHSRNRTYKLAPHVCKCTRYQDELYDMGMGMIEVLKD